MTQSTRTQVNEAQLAESAIARTLEEFAAVSRELQESYERLAERAAHVEAELAVSNRALELKVAELDALHADLATLLEALPCGVVVHDGTGRITSANPAAARILGCEEQDLACFSSERLAALAESPRLERVDPDGHAHVIGVESAPVPSPRVDVPAREVVILEDLTEHERLARVLATQNKMSALGTLSAGLAHEIRNPLNAVVGFASLLAAKLEAGGRHHHWAEQILAGAQETNRILTGLVDFARPGQLDAQEFSCHALLEEARDLVLDCDENRSEHAIELRCELEHLTGDRLKLRQALRNLIQNALEAAEGEARVRVHASSREGSFVLRVEDSGPGVDESARERLLEPFYTSRAEGTGLGLALTHAIAVLHGGELCAARERSDLGGAVFELSWPRAKTV